MPRFGMLLCSFFFLSGCMSLGDSISALNQWTERSTDTDSRVYLASFDTMAKEMEMLRPPDAGGRFDIYCDLGVLSSGDPPSMYGMATVIRPDAQGSKMIVYRNCRITGFTKSRSEIEKIRTGGVSSTSKEYDQTDHWFLSWLILELGDGRLAYIPPDTVQFIEQANTDVADQ